EEEEEEKWCSVAHIYPSDLLLPSRLVMVLDAWILVLNLVVIFMGEGINIWGIVIISDFLGW
ncbi:hypothetical protein CJU79_21140, partial [Pseudomonas fragi]